MRMHYSSKPFLARFLPQTSLAVLATVGLLLPSAWQPAEARPFGGRNLVQLMERDGRFNTLLAALDAAGLKETVATTRNLTLFAPTDDAFAALPEGTVESLLGDIPALSNILLYHVLGSTQTAYHLLSSSTVETLQGNPILVLREGSQVQVNGQSVVSANLRAGNGILHAIGGVLIPPAEDVSIVSMVDVLKLDGRFSVLLAALDAAGLTSTLEGSGSFTLLAPTDDAFAALPEGTVEALLNDIPTLQSILLYHVLGTRKPSWQLAAAGQASTLQGDVVTAKWQWPNLLINDSRVINPDVNAPNGVIHSLDKVLLPSAMSARPLGEVLAEDGRFTTLLAALQATGLDAALADVGPFTVFAPTDEAFARLPAGTLEYLLANPETLKSILLYHVVSGDLNTAELAAQRSATTLQGSKVRIYSLFGRTYVNNAYVLDGNNDAANGTFHAISRVLIPSWR